MATTTPTEPPAPGRPPGLEDPARHDFAALYERWFDDVCRWLRAMGGAERELEDLAQEVFLVARRRFAGFDGGSAPAWLYGIAWRVAADGRRRAWFRRWVGSDEAAAASVGGDPVELLERRESRLLLHQLLAQMSARRRTALVLSEVEGYTAGQIAELEGVKVATIWTRLHHARRELLQRLERWERQERRRSEGRR